MNAYAEFTLRLNQATSVAALESHTIADEAAQEAVGFLGKTVDLFSRFFFNFRTQLGGIFSNFKRSELRMYHESNPMRVSDIREKIGRLSFNTFRVAIPDGMRVTYLDAISTLNRLYDEAYIMLTLREMAAVADELKRMSFSEPSKEDIARITHATAEISRLVKSDVESSLQRCFTDSRTPEVSAHQAFAAPHDVLKADSQILAFELAFKVTIRVVAQAAALEKAYGRIVDVITQAKGADMTIVKALEEYLRQAALQLDLYGAIIHEMLRVEHNFVLVMKRLEEVEPTKKLRYDHPGPIGPG